MKYRYRRTVDSKDVEAGVDIPLFPQIEEDVVNSIVSLDLVPTNLDNLYSLAINGYGDQYNRLTYTCSTSGGIV